MSIFLCWITLPADIQNWDFAWISFYFFFFFAIIRNYRENNYFKTLLRFGKLCKYDDKWFHVFLLVITDLKNFSWCNVIQQITGFLKGPRAHSQRLRLLMRLRCIWFPLLSCERLESQIRNVSKKQKV